MSFATYTRVRVVGLRGLHGFRWSRRRMGGRRRAAASSDEDEDEDENEDEDEHVSFMKETWKQTQSSMSGVNSIL